jgi:hypothetical protein
MWCSPTTQPLEIRMAAMEWAARVLDARVESKTRPLVVQRPSVNVFCSVESRRWLCPLCRLVACPVLVFGRWELGKSGYTRGLACKPAGQTRPKIWRGLGYVVRDAELRYCAGGVISDPKGVPRCRRNGAASSRLRLSGT